MTRARCLVHVTDFVRPGGGPAGYLYNLRAGVESNLGYDRLRAPISVVGLVEMDARVLSPGINGRRKWLISLSNRALPAFARDYLYSRFFRSTYEKFAKSARLEAFFRDTLAINKGIVFHSPELFDQYRRYARERRIANIKVYMQHSPTSYAEQYILGHPVKLPPRGCTYRLIEQIEVENLKEADYLIVPFFESLEGYHSHDRLHKALQNARIVEIPTGIPDVSKSVSSLDKEPARLAKGLPVGKFIVGFLGRYHPHKGCDIAIEIARRLTDPAVLLLMAGAGPIAPPRLDNLVNLGWRSDVLDLIVASDVLIIPNRHTFFDILPLEAMALSRPIIVSPSGGNRALLRMSDGVLGVDKNDPDAYVELLKQLASDSRQLIEAGRNNRKAYEGHFTLDLFLQRHLEFARLLLGEATSRREAVATREENFADNGIGSSNSAKRLGICSLGQDVSSNGTL